MINPKQRQKPSLVTGSFDTRTYVQVVVVPRAKHQRAWHAIFARNLLAVHKWVRWAIIGTQSNLLLIAVRLLVGIGIQGILSPIDNACCRDDESSTIHICLVNILSKDYHALWNYQSRLRVEHKDVPVAIIPAQYVWILTIAGKLGAGRVNRQSCDCRKFLKSRIGELLRPNPRPAWSVNASNVRSVTLAWTKPCCLVDVSASEQGTARGVIKRYNRLSLVVLHVCIGLNHFWQTLRVKARSRPAASIP